MIMKVGTTPAAGYPSSQEKVVTLERQILLLFLASY
jgi:hypothetical protein